MSTVRETVETCARFGLRKINESAIYRGPMYRALYIGPFTAPINIGPYTLLQEIDALLNSQGQTGGYLSD